MTKLSQLILEKIKREDRQPISRWRFVLKNTAIWILGGFLLLLAAILVGTQLGNFIEAEWPIAPRWPGGRIGFLREIVSWVWLAGILIGVVGAVILFRFTRRGYRHSAIFLVITLTTTSAAVGSLLLPTPVPKFVRQIHQQYLPPRIVVEQFHNPQEGRLLGHVMDIAQDTVYLEAVDQHLWELWVFSDQIVSQDDFVEVFGEVIDPSTFAVFSIVTVPPQTFVQGIQTPFRKLD